jgi:hypothetical protein
MEILAFPRPNLEVVVFGQLRKHVRRARARRFCFRFPGFESEQFYTFKSHTAVARAGIQDEIAFDTVDGCLDDQMLRFCNFKFYLFVFFFFKDVVQVFHIYWRNGVKFYAKVAKFLLNCNFGL